MMARKSSRVADLTRLSDGHGSKRSPIVCCTAHAVVAYSVSAMKSTIPSLALRRTSSWKTRYAHQAPKTHSSPAL